MGTDVDTTLEIGAAAGEVYRYLHENGEVSVSKLRKDLSLSTGRVDQAIGWLAREEKVDFLKDRRTTLIRLKS